MNDTEVTKTILQMVRFIKQEAEEKASEIMVTAEEEFNITKLQLLEAEKAKVRREYERKEGTIDVRKKVQYSKQLNESRLKILQAREDAVQRVLTEAHSRLMKLSQDSQVYSALIKDLMVQAMSKLKEPKVLVRCREVDVNIVKSVIPSAAAEYATKYGDGVLPVIEVDEEHRLAPPPQEGTIGEEFNTCTGGVAVTSADGRIVCSNTLDDRLRISHSLNLPAIREVLFGTAENQ